MNESDIEKMAVSNIEAAYDQQHDYGSLAEAMESYWGNAQCTLEESGITTKESFEIVDRAFTAEIAKLFKA